MPRRGARPATTSRESSLPSAAGKPNPRTGKLTELEQPSTPERLGENLRRLALGLLAALLTARVYWPSEPDPSTGAGSGLTWVMMILAATGVAMASWLIGGRFRFRFSWTDVAVVALVVLVARSAGRGLDQRVAINLAWDWVGIGLAYLLARSLPRSPRETRVLVAGLLASAVAVSAYGLYQGLVEVPQLQERFRRNPQQVLIEAKVPIDPAHIETFKNRLLESNEIYATFALPNSLAGFLVGPLVLLIASMLETLANRRSNGSRWPVLGLAAAPLLCLLVCLMLAKSFSASIGLLVALVLLAWRARGTVPKWVLLAVNSGAAVVLLGLLAAGLASGRLDSLLLTQASRSLRYRWEYWVGTWGVISEGAATLSGAFRAATFWSGVGPGSFGMHYLLYKLPEASEEIQDPHNLFLEVWAVAGVWALIALAAALSLAFWNLLRPRVSGNASDAALRGERATDVSRETQASLQTLNSKDDPVGPRWLWFCSGLGLVLVLFVGEMNLFQNDLLARWLMLLLGWVGGALLIRPLWTRSPASAPALGVGVVAVTINLLAQGGIGFPAVSIALWLMVALGLNLSEEPGSARLREVDSRLPGLALALAWAALFGAFAGQIIPYWRSQAELARADDALAHRPPDLERAGAAYLAAIKADPLNVQAFLGEAYLHSLAWESRGARPSDKRWQLVLASLKLAASPPRNSNSWTLHSERAKITRDILTKVAHELSPQETIKLQGSIVEATRTSSRLYPTNATLHARLAEASAEISMFQDAVQEAQEALRLDALTPHADKKLSEDLRRRLQSSLPEWTEKAARFPVK